MPIAKFQMPDGRIANFEVPEGTTAEQAQAQIEQFIANQKPAEQMVTSGGEVVPASQVPSDVPIATDDGVMFSGDAAKAQQPPKPEPTTMEKLTGMGETALTAATGMTGGAFGMTKGFLQGLAQEIREGKFGTQEAADRIEQMAMQEAQKYTYAPRTETGQEYTQELGEVAQQVPAVIPMAGQLPTLGQTVKAIKPGITEKLRPVIESKPVQTAVNVAEAVTEPVGRGLTKTGQALAKPVTGSTELVTKGARKFIETATGETKRKLAKGLREDPYNADYAGIKLVKGKPVPDATAENAMKQGWRPGFVQAVKASDNADKAAFKQMFDIFKKGKTNDRYRAANRPADIVGKTFESRVDNLFGIKRVAVDELNKAAEGLKTKRVNYAPAIDKFEQNLRDLGVKIAKGNEPMDSPDFQVGKIRVSLKGSDIEGNPASEALLKRIYSRLSSDIPQSGYDLHRAKRWIDTQVEIGKKSKDGLLNQTANIVKGLRHDINESLRGVSSKYKNANIKYKDALDQLDAIQAAVGTKKDLAGKNVDKALGQEARKLLSKYGNRVNMMNAIEDAEKVISKYAGKQKGDIMNQIIVANEIDHMFGDVAPGSFKAQIRSAGETGLEAMRKSRAELAGDLISGAYRKLKGINEENAIKSMEALIGGK